MDEMNRKKQTQSPPRHGEDADLRRRLDEEYASELNATAAESGTSEEVISMYGWIAIALAALSFFIWPLVFSIGAVILGFVSRAKGAQVLGNIAIAIAVFSIIVRFLLFPFA